jgi:hypothetical protein
MKKVLGLSVILAGLAATPAFANCARDIDRIANSSAPLSPDARQHLSMAEQALRRGDENGCNREIDTVIADIRAADRMQQSNREYDRRDRYDRRYDDRYDRRYDDRGSSGSSSNPLGRLLDNLGR